MKKETEPTTSSDYCKGLYYPFPNDDKAKADVLIISDEFFKYVKINETTYTCFCKPAEERQACYDKFLNLDNADKGKPSQK